MGKYKHLEKRVGTLSKAGTFSSLHLPLRTECFPIKQPISNLLIRLFLKSTVKTQNILVMLDYYELTYCVTQLRNKLL